MNNILDQICKKKEIELEEEKQRCSYKTLEMLLNNIENRGFKKLLTNSQIKKNNNLITEIKRASPSAGIIIKEGYFPELIAQEYEKSGAGAISILTEKNYFNGSIDHLSLINKKSNLPLLRKDFIIDPYQILQSKVYRADAILLIVAILTDNQIKEFIDLSKKYGLDCLVEIHSEEELERAINIGYPLIGINNRNLKNLKTNIDNTIRLLKNIPNNFTIVAESGIKEYNDIKRYNDLGIYNFLIGESILKSSNYSEKIKELIGQV